MRWDLTEERKTTLHHRPDRNDPLYKTHGHTSGKDPDKPHSVFTGHIIRAIEKITKYTNAATLEGYTECKYH